MTFSPAQQSHVSAMRAVLASLADTPLALKGGTALLLCHGLDRFSEDLDFDAPKKLNLESRMEQSLSRICTRTRISRTKDTDTVQRYRIEYEHQGIEGRLKVEVSCRDLIDESTTMHCDGIRTYRVERLFAQKVNAFEHRTTARDLYDLHFLLRRHRDHLAADDLSRLRHLMNDLSAVEARFRPAFEEDDLFRSKSEALGEWILEMQAKVG